MKEKLLSMRIGQMEDFIFSNGVIQSHKTIVRNSEYEWQVHCYASGWNTATLDLDQTADYLTGKLSSLEISWQ